MTDNWQLRVRQWCPHCNGSGRDCLSHYVCHACGGDGKVRQNVPAAKVDEFLARPEKLTYVCCTCDRTEAILRPIQHQLPSGWLNWSGDLLCNICKEYIVGAAIIAVDSWVQRMKNLKEKKENEKQVLGDVGPTGREDGNEDD